LQRRQPHIYKANSHCYTIYIHYQHKYASCIRSDGVLCRMNTDRGRKPSEIVVFVSTVPVLIAPHTPPPSRTSHTGQFGGLQTQVPQRIPLIRPALATHVFLSGANTTLNRHAPVTLYTRPPATVHPQQRTQGPTRCLRSLLNMLSNFQPPTPPVRVRREFEDR